MNHRVASVLVAMGICLCGRAVLADEKPLKVFILAGQSNMQGHAHVRTLDVLALDPTTVPLLGEIRDADGTPRVQEQVWITSIGSSAEEQTGQLTTGFGAEKNGPKIGPELAFGFTMQKELDQPILIIKTAWGGKSLYNDFRSPSAGPYKFNEQQLKSIKDKNQNLEQAQAETDEQTGVYYRLMLDHVRLVLKDIKRVYPEYDAEQGYELAGFVWFQGWNDMVNGGVYPNRGKPGGYDQYSELLAHFIRDVRKDLAAPDMPFVIGVMGAGGPVEKYSPDKLRYAGIHREFRNAMAAPATLPEFDGNVAAVLTENYWDMELEQLRAKDKQIQNEIKAAQKEGKLSAQDAGAALEKRRAETFSPREREILAKGASNFEFHYLGSAKIMAQIGQGFAETTLELIEEDSKN